VGKQQHLVPTFVLLGALAILLACSRLTNVPGAPNPTAPPPGVERNPDQWLKDFGDSWLARLTSLVTIVGIGLAVKAYEVSRSQLRTGQKQLHHQLEQIQREQKRIADALNRRPEFAISFHRSGLTDQTSRLPDHLKGRASAPTTLWMRVENTGTGSANQVNITVLLNGLLPRDGPTLDELAHPDPDLVVMVRSSDGVPVGSRNEPFLHRGMVSILAVPVAVPNSTATYRLRVAVTCAEIECTEAILTLRVEGAG
jgi:hypothetical protein